MTRILRHLLVVTGAAISLATATSGQPIEPATGANAAVHDGPVRNIVLVHGAFADGSGWRDGPESAISRG